MADVINGDTLYKFMDSGTNATTPNNWYSVQSTANWMTPHMEGGFAMNTKGNGVTDIHPMLYFKYLKSKLNMIEMALFKERMSALEKAADEFAEIGQEALQDDCIRRFMILSREAAIYACGYKTYIKPEHVDKFRYKIKEGSLKITPLKNFARAIPDNVANKIKDCMKKKLFDEYVVFHLDDRTVSVKETEKERIERKKDPIVFGKIEHSENYYFIADWIDDLDDLTLKVFLKKIGVDRRSLAMSRKIGANDVFGQKDGAERER